MAASRKLHDLIKATGEYAIEAWVAPGNVVQEESRIISYSAGTTARNFTLGQTIYSYDFYNRSSSSDGNGDPLLQTSDADEDLQATLQHVVLTTTRSTVGRSTSTGSIPTTRTRSPAAPSATGTIPSRWCSATRPRAIASGRA